MQIFSVYFQKQIPHFFDNFLGKLWNFFCSSVNSTTFANFLETIAKFSKIEMKP
jgi:hypothetical protein